MCTGMRAGWWSCNVRCGSLFCLDRGLPWHLLGRGASVVYCAFERQALRLRVIWIGWGGRICSVQYMVIGSSDYAVVFV